MHFTVQVRSTTTISLACRSGIYWIATINSQDYPTQVNATRSCIGCRFFGTSTPQPGLAGYLVFQVMAIPLCQNKLVNQEIGYLRSKTSQRQPISFSFNQFAFTV